MKASIAIIYADQDTGYDSTQENNIDLQSLSWVWKEALSFELWT